MWISRIFPEHFFCATTSGSSYTSRWKLDQWLLMTHVLQFNNEVEIQYWQKKNEDIWSSKYVSFTASNSGRDISKNEILPKAHIFRLNCLENLIWKVSPWAVPAFKSGWVKIYNCFIPKFQYNVLPYSSLYGIF